MQNPNRNVKRERMYPPSLCPISEAYSRLLNQIVPNDPEGRTFAECIANAMVLRAIRGDVQAVKEITDRIEGRVSDQRRGRIPDQSEPPPTLKVVYENRTQLAPQK